MRARGWGPWRAEWYSICSAHRTYDEACQRCRAGMWHNVIVRRIDSAIYKRWPEFWRWWHNCWLIRRIGRGHRFLRATFPNLRT